MSSCPSGYFENHDLGACQHCDPTCETCFGSSNSECLTCSSYAYEMLSEDNSEIVGCSWTCPTVDKCNNTVAFVDEWARTCQACSSDCARCVQNDDNEVECLAYYEHKLEANGTSTDLDLEDECLEGCPSGYYLELGECFRCR